MKDQLTIKEIAPYLPYDLNIRIEGDEHTHVLVGLENSLEGLLLISPWGDFGRAKYEHAKLVLRSLSDLTKEIEHNGRKFIPIVELAKMNDSYVKWDATTVTEFDHKRIMANGFSYSVKGINSTSNMGDLVNEFEYSSRFNRFANRDNTRKMPLSVGNQLEMFQKLYEWKFDLHNLIDRGLAIDINTITK